MTTPRVPVKDIVARASYWKKNVYGDYIALVDASYQEYEPNGYTRDELVECYGDLIDTIDAGIAWVPEGTILAQHGYWGICVDMVYQHMQRPPLEYQDQDGVTNYIYKIHEIYSHDEDKDAILMSIERYTLTTSPEGNVYVEDFSNINTYVPVTWFENYFPDALGRLKAALGLGLKDDLSDKDFVHYVCHGDNVKAEKEVTMPQDLELV